VLAVAVTALLLQWRLAAAAPAALRRRPRASNATGTPSARRGVLAWAIALTLVAIFEIANYFQAPRRDHPTLSYLLDGVGEHHWTKAIAFAVWLLLGWYLVRR
jgi:hypothetical protein